MQPQLRDRSAVDVRDLHAGELRAARAGPRAAHVRLSRGRRLLPHAPGAGRARHAVPLLGRDVLRRGADRSPRQRLLLRPGRDQAVEPWLREAAHADGGLQAGRAVQLPGHRGGSPVHARGDAQGARGRRAGAAEEDHAQAVHRAGRRLRRRDHGLRQASGAHRLPPDLDLRDRIGRRPRAARLRLRGPARRGCLRHADDHARQHQRRDDHDRREGGGHDQGGSRTAA